MEKVCHLTSVHNRYDPRILYKECTSLAKFGYDTKLIVANDLENENINNVEIIDVGKSKSRIQRFSKTTWRIYKRAIKIDAKIYHFHDPELIWIGILLKIRGKCVVYDIHEDYFTSFKDKNYLNIFAKIFIVPFFLIIDRLANKIFHIIIAEKYYIKRYPKGIQILNYPIIEKNEKKDNSELTKKLLYTGNITAQRGAFIMSQMINEIPDIEIFCVGFCKKEIADKMFNITNDKNRLHIIGIEKYISKNIINDYYSKNIWLAGLAIFPDSPHYRNKELTKFFEYMRAGLPIICSDFNAWKKLINKNNVGFTANPKDFKGISNAINKLYFDQTLVQKFSINGKRAFESIYNWNQEEKKLFSFYRMIINDNKKI